MIRYYFLNDHSETVMTVDMIENYLITGSKDKTINLFELIDRNSV